MDWFYTFLTSIVVFITAPSIPNHASDDWQVIEEWVPHGASLKLAVRSTSIPLKCQSQPGAYLVTEILGQGFHEFYLDGKLIMRTGDKSFAEASSMYNVARLPCYLLEGGRVLAWNAFNLTNLYSKAFDWPQIVSARNPPDGTKWIKRCWRMRSRVFFRFLFLSP